MGCILTLTKSHDELMLEWSKLILLVIINSRQHLTDFLTQKCAIEECIFLANKPSLYFTQASFSHGGKEIKIFSNNGLISKCTWSQPDILRHPTNKTHLWGAMCMMEGNHRGTRRNPPSNLEIFLKIKLFFHTKLLRKMYWTRGLCPLSSRLHSRGTGPLVEAQ